MVVFIVVMMYAIHSGVAYSVGYIQLNHQCHLQPSSAELASCARTPVDELCSYRFFSLHSNIKSMKEIAKSTQTPIIPIQ